jgi:uracil-DNA glycosylase
LLLNTVLTVQQGQAHSHAKLGWETFTDKIIAQINQHNDGCVFILWGAHAQKKGRNIDESKHLILNGPHPSPLSVYRGFYGSKPFSKANQWLASHRKLAIDWRINNSE